MNTNYDLAFFFFFDKTLFFRVGVVLGRISLVILSGAIGSNTHHIITIWLPEKENIKALKGAKIVS